jgi:hypothetical protein
VIFVYCADTQVPLLDPFDRAFEMNDTAMIWTRELRDRLEDIKVDLPVIIIGEDGYGTKNRPVRRK